MEENNLERKIKKELEFIKDEVSKFLRSFEPKNIKSHNFTPYLQAINSVFDLNNSYGEDYYEFIEKKNLHFLLANNRLLMKDISEKLKGLTLYMQKDKTFQSKLQKQSEGICKICNQHIESQSIQLARDNVEDLGINHLKKMLKKIEEESNMAMFSPEEDKHFFRQLNRVLTKKQEVLAITDNHLENYLDDIMKKLEEIKYLEELKDTTFPLPQSINWQKKIKIEINQTLLSSFKGKVPPWIQKTFEYFIKLHQKLIRQFRESKQCQTDPYTQDQVFDLKKVMEMHKEQEKASKKINQDYIKMIEQKNEKIRILEMENSMMKGNSYVKQINFNKATSSNRQSKDLRSSRNSSLKNQNSDQNEPKKSKFKSMMPNSFHESDLARKVEEKMYQILEQKNKQNYGNETRSDHSATDHVPSTLAEPQIKRKNNKKFTDVDYFRKTRSNKRHQSFLPTISQKGYKDSIQSVQNPHDLKKASILSLYSQKNTKFFDNGRNQTNIEPLEIGQSFEHKNSASKSIAEVKLNNQKDFSESEINFIQNLSDSDRLSRVKRYKETVSDVQNHLESKIKNIQALKKLKNNNSFILSNGKQTSQHQNTISQLNRLRNQKDHSTKIISVQKQAQVKKVDYMTQTDIGQEKQRKALQISENQYIFSEQSNLKKLQSQIGNFNSREVQTEQTKLQILKRFQNNQNLSQISDQHLQNILSKLLFNPHIHRKQSKSKKDLKKEQKNKKDLIEKTLNQSKYEGDKEISNIHFLEQVHYDRIAAKSVFASKTNSKYEDMPVSEIRNNKHKTRFDCQTNSSSFNEQVTDKIHLSLLMQTCFFTNKDFTLFISEQNAYKYESNLKHRYHPTPFLQLTESQVKSLTSLFGLFQLIKQHSLHQYNHILSFVKYPYQTVVNNFSILNIVKEMSLESWLWYMARIKSYHVKCFEKGDINKTICIHVQKFSQKIQSILVEVARKTVDEIYQTRR